MKKKLIIINGTMGVGKTATCTLLNKSLEKSVWLDGDWCWMINPFIVNDENKTMVEDNIKHLLRNFLKNSTIDYVIFNWVLHTEDMFKMALEWVDDIEFDLVKITLTCSEEELIRRLSKDIEGNLRQDCIISKSIERLRMYNELNTIKVDTGEFGIKETVNQIMKIVNGSA